MSFYTNTHTVLEAVPYDSLQYNCSILNLSAVDDSVVIHVPERIAKYLILESIKDISADKYIDLESEYCIRESFHPWYTLDSSLLDLTVGFHQYRMNFISSRLQDTISLYFEYQIYTDKLEKPYIYMERYEDN